jgi:hypothetical protein
VGLQVIKLDKCVGRRKEAAVNTEVLNQAEIAVRLDTVEVALANDVAWTNELVRISSGDVYVDDLPFGTYFAATYPESQRPANFIINALNADGTPVLSLSFAYDPGKPGSLRQLGADESPWTEEGVIVGPIPTKPTKQERPLWTNSAKIEQVANKLLLIEPNLLTATKMQQ